MLRMIQSASKVIGYMSKYILESFWSSHSFSKMLVFLVLLFFFPSKHFSLYPKMHNDSVWLILSNWCVKGHSTLLSPLLGPHFLNCTNPTMDFSLPESIAAHLAYLHSWAFVLSGFLCICMLFLFLFFFFFFLFAFQPFHLSCLSKPGLGITSFGKTYLMNSKWLFFHVSLGLSTQFLLC